MSNLKYSISEKLAAHVGEATLLQDSPNFAHSFSVITSKATCMFLAPIAKEPYLHI